MPKKRVTKSLTILDIYKKYKTKVKAGSKYDVSKDMFKKICYQINKEIVNYILEEVGEFKLPLYMGKLRIKKGKLNLNKLPLDYKHYNATGEKVYLLNEHRNEHIYGFYWQKGRIINKTAYKFIPTRKNKRRLGTLLKTDFTKDYLS